MGLIIQAGWINVIENAQSKTADKERRESQLYY